jgi:hypothetical protein
MAEWMLVAAVAWRFNPVAIQLKMEPQGSTDSSLQFGSLLQGRISKRLRTCSIV